MDLLGLSTYSKFHIVLQKWRRYIEILDYAPAFFAFRCQFPVFALWSWCDFYSCFFHDVTFNWYYRNMVFSINYSKWRRKSSYDGCVWKQKYQDNVDLLDCLLFCVILFARTLRSEMFLNSTTFSTCCFYHFLHCLDIFHCKSD